DGAVGWVYPPLLPFQASLDDASGGGCRFGEPQTIHPCATASLSPAPSSVYPDRRRRRHAAPGLDAADALPRILDARLLAYALVALHEARDEKLLRQRR